MGRTKMVELQKGLKTMEVTCRNSLQEMILQDRVSGGQGPSGDYLTFLKGVAENIITMEKIVKITIFLFENFLKWLCLPMTSSIPETAETLTAFCKDVNEATREVLKDLARGEEKRDKPEKAAPGNLDKGPSPNQGVHGMKISLGDLQSPGLKKVQLRPRPSRPAEPSSVNNELSSMFAKFNKRNQVDNEEEEEEEDNREDKPADDSRTRTYRGVTIRRTKKRNKTIKQKPEPASGLNGLRGKLA